MMMSLVDTTVVGENDDEILNYSLLPKTIIVFSGRLDFTDEDKIH